MQQETHRKTLGSKSSYNLCALSQMYWLMNVAMVHVHELLDISGTGCNPSYYALCLTYNLDTKWGHNCRCMSSEILVVQDVNVSYNIPCSTYLTFQMHPQPPVNNVYNLQAPHATRLYSATISMQTLATTQRHSS